MAADVHLNGREGQLCPSVELEVSRNYRLESQNPPVAPISLGENGEKYWGITVDQLSNRVSSHLFFEHFNILLFGTMFLAVLLKD